MHKIIYFKYQNEEKCCNELRIQALEFVRLYKRPHTSFDMLFLVSEYTHIASNFVTTNYHSRLVCVCVCVCALLMAIMG